MSMQYVLDLELNGVHRHRIDNRFVFLGMAVRCFTFDVVSFLESLDFNFLWKFTFKWNLFLELLTLKCQKHFIDFSSEKNINQISDNVNRSSLLLIVPLLCYGDTPAYMLIYSVCVFAYFMHGNEVFVLECFWFMRKHIDNSIYFWLNASHRYQIISSECDCFCCIL